MSLRRSPGLRGAIDSDSLDLASEDTRQNYTSPRNTWTSPANKRPHGHCSHTTKSKASPTSLILFEAFLPVPWCISNFPISVHASFLSAHPCSPLQGQITNNSFGCMELSTDLPPEYTQEPLWTFQPAVNHKESYMSQNCTMDIPNPFFCLAASACSPAL